MKRVFICTFMVVFLLLVCLSNPIQAQQNEKKDNFESFIDSISNRIEKLQAQLPKLKNGRSIGYFNCKRDLDQSIFIKAFEQYIKNEELEEAKELVLKKLDRAKFRRDEHSLTFYSEHKKR